MRERAEELGGTLSVETNDAGGTTVMARLPLADGAPRDRPGPGHRCRRPSDRPGGLRALIDATPGIVLVGEATDGDAAIELARRVSPMSS